MCNRHMEQKARHAQLQTCRAECKQVTVPAWPLRALIVRSSILNSAAYITVSTNDLTLTLTETSAKHSKNPLMPI